jgi:hypothetical protein
VQRRVITRFSRVYIHALGDKLPYFLNIFGFDSFVQRLLQLLLALLRFKPCLRGLTTTTDKKQRH